MGEGRVGGEGRETEKAADEHSDHRPQPKRNQAENRLSPWASAGIHPFQQVTAQAFCLPNAFAHVETREGPGSVKGCGEGLRG